MGSILGDIYDSEKDKLHKRDKESAVMTRKFNIGDKVWDMRFGWGVVKRYAEGRLYPVEVLFYGNGECNEFTDDGRYHTSDVSPTLFFEEIPIPETALRKTKWRADNGCNYYFIDTFGDVVLDEELRYPADNKRFKAGNYFKTEEDAKASTIYKGFHGEL